MTPPVALALVVGDLTQTLALVAVVVLVVGFLLYVPILKPWFGFCRPPGSTGRWWT